MRFEWDENKNRSNQAKHGISFSKAREAFYDPNQIAAYNGVEDGEDRWKTFGLIGYLSVIVVISTFRDDYSGEEIIRIISARPALPYERAFYETENG